MSNPNINFEHLRRQIERGYRVQVNGVEYSRVEDLPASIPGHPAAEKPGTEGTDGGNAEKQKAESRNEGEGGSGAQLEMAQVRKDLEKMNKAALMKVAAELGVTVAAAIEGHVPTNAQIREAIRAKLDQPVPSQPSQA